MNDERDYGVQQVVSSIQQTFRAYLGPVKVLLPGLRLPVKWVAGVECGHQEELEVIDAS